MKVTAGLLGLDTTAYAPAADYVPYTGAAHDVDLGSNRIDAFRLGLNDGLNVVELAQGVDAGYFSDAINMASFAGGTYAGYFYGGGGNSVYLVTATHAIDAVGTIATSTIFNNTVATGTAPYQCTSTTLNTNLNADLLDGQEGAYYAQASLYVPYTGATGAVALGANTLSTTSGLISPKIYPSSDSTTAVGIFKADATTNVLDIDTTNGWVGIGKTPADKLNILTGAIRFNAPSAAGAPSAALAGLGAGNLSNGTYYYKISYVWAGTSEKAVGTNSSVVTVADYTTNGQIALSSISTSADLSVTARNIYRTPAGGGTYCFLAQIGDNTTTTYTDNISDATISVKKQAPGFDSHVFLSIATNPTIRVQSGNQNMEFAAGALLCADTAYTSTVGNSVAKFGTPAYTKAQIPFYTIVGKASSTTNIAYIGGGYSTGQAATAINLYTADAITTATGTLRMAFISDGEIQIPADFATGAAGALSFGAAQDMEMGYTGTVGRIDTSLVAPSDLQIDCGTDKTLILDETVYKDINIAGYLLGKPSASYPGTDTFRTSTPTDTGIETYAFAEDEKVHGGFELQHDYKEGTDLVFHVHFQIIAAPTGTDNVQWRLAYVVMRDGVTLTTVTTIDSPDTAVDTQYRAYRSDFGAITGTTFKIGDQFMFALTRVSATGDAFAGDALIETAGIHYEVDTLGSRTISSK